MILTINDSKYKAKFNKSGHLMIKLKKTKDKIFFNSWYHRVRQDVGNKTGFSINIQYKRKTYILKKGVERGFLMGSFPIMSLNGDKVRIVYDISKINKK